MNTKLLRNAFAGAAELAPLGAFERLLKIKDDRRIRLEILEAARGVVEVPNVETNAEREFKKFQKRKMKRSMAGGQGRSMYGTMNDASDLI